MPNKNYVKGRKKEYAIVKKLKEEGYDIVVRSAGSHSAIDVWAINRKLRTIKLIQAKPEEFHIKVLEDKYRWLNNVFRVTFEVI